MTRRKMIEFAALGVGAAALAEAQLSPFTLPKLPYAFDALEPHIDAQTMEIHHDKHHQAYVTNLNKAVGADPGLSRLTLDELLARVNTLPDAVRSAVRNNGGGHTNHSLFWETLAPESASGKPSGKLAKAIDKMFGSQAQMEDRLKAAATAVFGSGWGWVSVAPSGALAVEALPNQDSLLTAGRRPLFGIDVWEHAYYLKYQNRRADYLAAITHVLNWDFISHRYEELAR